MSVPHPGWARPKPQRPPDDLRGSVLLGMRMEEARTKAGLSQRTVARRVGVDHGTVSKWEAGKRGVSVTNLVALSRVFGLDDATLGRWVRLAAGDV